MVDFAEINRRMYEEASPEARARMDAARETEARVEATKGSVLGHFEGFRSPPRFARGSLERVVERTWERPLEVMIEGPPEREVIRFRGAVTGHEAYALDESFCASLVDPAELSARPRFYICAGTPGRYDGCWVDPAEVEGYLRERRPELFPASAPTP